MTKRKRDAVNVGHVGRVEELPLPSTKRKATKREPLSVQAEINQIAWEIAREFYPLYSHDRGAFIADMERKGWTAAKAGKADAIRVRKVRIQEV